MAIQCTHCGTTLKDDARFCNICGTLVPSHPFSAKSNMSSSSPSRAGQADSTIIRRGMREQIAQQPPERPVRRVKQDEPPSWMSQLTSEPRPRTPSDGLKYDQQESFSPLAQVDALPKQRDFNTTSGFQPDTFEQDEKTQIVSPTRESRWKERQNQSADQHLQNDHIQSVQQQQQINDDVEDLPTRPLVVEVPTKVKSQPDAHTTQTTHTTSTPPALPTPPLPSGRTISSKEQKTPFVPGDVDQLDTVPMATPMGVKPHTPSRPVAEPVQPQRQPGQQRQQGQRPPSSQPSYQHASGSGTQDHFTMVPVAPIPATPTPDARKASPSMAPPIQSPKQRKSRRPLAIILGILLLLLIGGGIGTWIVLEQPFTIAGVTQPQQTFSNAQIGVSLSYPTGWTAKVDAKKTTVFLSDSSQTAQFKVISGPTNGGDVGKYLQQEASQQNMTGLKPVATQTFAGTSWQQVQGSVLLNGASYSETLFATVHGQHLYTILQLAPQSTYSQEEQYVFSAMRSSFKFLP